MSLARGLAAAFDGFAKGVRLAGEEDDRAQRQELAKRQLEAADLELEQRRRERDYQNEIKALATYREQQAKGGQSGEVVDEFGVNLGRMTYMGDNKPESGGLQFTGETQQVAPRTTQNDPDFARQMVTKANAIKLKYGKIDDVQALKGMNDFVTLQKTGAADALTEFLRGGSEDDALAKARQFMKIPEGTRLVRKVDKIVADMPDSPINRQQSFDMVGPDGTKIADWTTISQSLLDPKSLGELQHRLMDTALKHKHYSDQAAHWTALEGLEGKKLDNQISTSKITLERLRQAGERDIRRLQLAEDEAAARKLQQAATGAANEVISLTGFKAVKPEEFQFLTEDQKKAYAGQQRVISETMSLWEMNLNDRGVPQLRPATALKYANAYDAASKNPEDAKKWNASLKFDEQKQLPYLEEGGKKVYVRRLPEPQAPQAAPPQPAPRRGVTPPQQNPAAPPPVQVPNGGDPLSRATDAQLEAAANSGNRYAVEELARRKSLYRGAPASEAQFGINPGA